jgi:hypothetical protein
VILNGVSKVENAASVAKNSIPKAKDFANHGGEFLDDATNSVSGVGRGVQWNLGEAVITKSHHNWNKIFGDKAITLSDVEPILKEAVEKGTWQITDVLRGKGGKIIGDKLELIQEVNGHKIWVGGMKEYSSGKMYINNGAVQ